MGLQLSQEILMKYLVAIECTDAGGFEIGLAITRMGYKPLFLLNPQSYKADLSHSLQNFEYRSLNTLSVESIVESLKPIRDQIAGITTLVDSRIAIAAKAAMALRVPGPDPACIILKDKVAVAKICSEYSLPTLALTADAKFAEEQLLTKFKNLMVVAKQRAGCGAVGIQFLNTDQEKINFARNTQKLNEWLIQEYFDGALYSMEGWVENSQTKFLGWTSRRKIGNTETEFKFEGYHALPSLITSRAQKAINKLFLQSGYFRGWYHIEFLVNKSQQRVVMIDANIGRVGGAMLPHVLAMAFNKEPALIYQHAIETQIFGGTKISLNTKHTLENIYKCICFGAPRDAVIQEVLLPKSPLQTAGLRTTRILGPGDYVTRIGHDDWSWIGFVAGAEAEVDQYASGIQIRSEDGKVYKAAF